MMRQVTDAGEHPDVETLSALGDGELSEVQEARLAAHLRACAACRGQVEALSALAGAVRELPRELPPPPEAWAGIQARVARERVAAGVPRARWWHNGWLAAAAAVVLVAGTTLVVRGLATTGPAATARSDAVGSAAPAAPEVLAVDGTYAATLSDLRLALDLQREALSPQTVRVVEQSLAVIDAAIAEARLALAADPANDILVRILAAQYERKVDLLQRAAQLSPTT